MYEILISFIYLWTMTDINQQYPCTHGGWWCNGIRRQTDDRCHRHYSVQSIRAALVCGTTWSLNDDKRDLRHMPYESLRTRRRICRYFRRFVVIRLIKYFFEVEVLQSISPYVCVGSTDNCLMKLYI